MEPMQPKVAVTVRTRYGRFVDPTRDIDEAVVFLTIDTEIDPEITYALSADQARALGEDLLHGPAA